MGKRAAGIGIGTPAFQSGQTRCPDAAADTIDQGVQCVRYVGSADVVHLQREWAGEEPIVTLSGADKSVI